MKLALALLMTAFGAQAFQAHRAADGQNIRWAGGIAVVRLVQPAPAIPLQGAAGLRKAVVDAALAWQAVQTAHFPVRFGGTLALDRPAEEGEILVEFDVGTFPGTNDVAGQTDVDVSGHEILSARIHLNARDFTWATDGRDTALDVQTIVGHELGHAFGLAHPCGDDQTDVPSCRTLPTSVIAEMQTSLMYPTFTPGPHRALSADDRTGIASLLPATAAEPAPKLTSIAPSCAANAEEQPFSFVQSGGTHVEVWQGGEPKFDVELDDASNAVFAPPEGISDVTLVAASGKADVKLDALRAAVPCPDPSAGCTSAGAVWFGVLPLLAFVMRKRRALAAVALVVLGAAAPAHAYKRSKNAGDLCIWWSTRGHSFMIDSRGTPDVPGLAAFTAIRKSFAQWSTPTCSDLAFPDLGLSQAASDRRIGFFPGEYNRNLVLFRTANCKIIVPAGDSCVGEKSCANKYDCWDRDENVIATTTTTSNRYTGQITDSDIEINNAPRSDGSRNFRFTAVDGPPCGDPNQTGCVEIDVQNTITHEAGHSIGLDHTPVQDATMYASAPPGEVTKRALHDDDVRAVCEIYPKGERTATCLNDPITLTAGSASDGGGCGCSHSSPSGAMVALGLLAVALRARRRR